MNRNVKRVGTWNAKKLKVSVFVIVCSLMLGLTCLCPAVQAAGTTTVYHVSGPSSVVAGSEAPIPVTATIYYNNTVQGYQLVVGILDADLSPERIVPGIVVSSTDPCINQPEPTALCAITVPKSSGVERIDFQIGGIFGGRRQVGRWNLNITSALIGPQNSIIPGSVSNELFEINLTSVALNVVVPASVVVSIDGVREAPGSASVGVAMGQHNITVPELVNVTASTRLRFDRWSDGYPTVVRDIVVMNDTTLKVVYVTQNLLTLVGVGENSSIAWYDADTNATLSVNQNQPLTGVLGAIGGRLTFGGWYESGQLLSSSPTTSITMSKPHTVTAVWQVDYTIPTAVAFAAIAVVVLTFLALRGRNASRRRRRRTKPRRKHR